MWTTRLDKVRRLSRDERWLLYRSFLLLPAIHVALLTLGYSRLRSALEKMTPLKPVASPPLETEILQKARGIAQIVSIAARHGMYKATCLRRSLLVWWFLRGEGVQSHIRFGVRKRDAQLEAHAWVEYNGIIVNDSTTVREYYLVLQDNLPPTQWGL